MKNVNAFTAMRLCALCVALCAPGTAHVAQARPAGTTTHYTFSVLSGAITRPADERSAQRLIDAASRAPALSFVVYDGNLKGAHEACTDALYARRHAILDASRAPLVFVPGQRDWVNCVSPAAVSVDPLERLDQLRSTFFPDSASMGQRPLMLTRESETSRFQPYRENMRWQVGNTVFITLNLPGGNNHYLDAGGRNGEFEDRAIANASWLERAGEYAKQRNARALVVFFEASPFGKLAQRADRFAWLRRIGRQQPADAYAEFRRSLVKLAQAFHGPIVLIHASDENLAHGFLIDQPLRNDRGAKITNVTRVALGLHAPRAQWLHIDADTARHPFLRVSVRNAPR